eukprot:GHVL01025273.1.p1 GENE.GHVL01025273.1~~GHVL01025273.1.p1  ORF type:complete len:531 (+),score=122.19 GHVL01025273.1:236-1594(+)
MKYIKESKIPVLGVCYGLQEIVWRLGGEVIACNQTCEYGNAKVVINKDSDLFTNIDSNEINVWMSHGDQVKRLPDGFKSIATTKSCEYCVISDNINNIYGIQFHPEVSHTIEGIKIIKNFIFNICKIEPSWSIHNFIDGQIEKIRKIVGDKHVIGALSGGVDSTVGAALMSKAIGDKFTGIIIDTGMLRYMEGEQVLKNLRKILPTINLDIYDCSSDFLNNLKDVSCPEKKRKIIGGKFIDNFQRISEEKGLILDECFLMQGTLYPDVIESVSFHGPSVTIKSHHNVGGLPERMKLKVIEPLRELFKDEVRELGTELGLDSETVWRHPFPGPGLAIRILGEVTKERLDTLRQADSIYIEELKNTKNYDKIGQAFIALLPTVKSVGVMGDNRTYEMACVIRAVTTSDYMTADWYPMPYDVLSKISNRIINEVSGINRCVYDVTSKPPGTIEWE